MTGGPSGSMTYDGTHVHAAITASSFPNQYASYDAMGNMTCRNVDTGSGHTCGSGQSGATMTYDNEGRLASWVAPSGTTASDQFLYDNEGNRVLQRTNDRNGITDTITFDGFTESSIHSGTTTTTKYYGAGMCIGTGSPCTLYYLVPDFLGSSSLVFTSTGSLQAAQLYAPYGAVRYLQGTLPNNYTYNYTGQRLDSETGLLYYSSRYYDPVSGRFVRADTVQTNASGLDPYAYVGDSPETYTDPTGHFIDNGGIREGGGGGGGGSPSSPPISDRWDIPQHVNSCGAYTQGDCTIAAWAAISRITGYTPIRVPLEGGPGGILCIDLGPCLATGGLGGPSVTAAVPISLTFTTPLAGCATATTCLVHDQGVDDKPTDGAAELGIEPATEPGGAGTAAAAGGCSFTSTTQVMTERGKQAIGTLHVGDKVLAYNPKSHKMEAQPILHVWINHDNDLVDLTLTTYVPAQHGHAATKISEVIHTNQKHPFLTEEKGFLPVGQITLGMHLLRADGRFGLVTGWKSVSGSKVMYNLEVAHDHNFTVGEGQWVVHNECGSGTPSGNNPFAQSGNRFHYDQLNGGPTGSIGGPSQLQALYPQTEFEFTPRGVAGPDVQVAGGIHPADTSVYPDSTWPLGSDYGDFKPYTSRGQRQFRYEISTSSCQLIRFQYGTIPCILSL